MEFVLTYIPLFLMAGILAWIVVVPLISREMPDYPDHREKRD